MFFRILGNPYTDLRISRNYKESIKQIYDTNMKIISVINYKGGVGKTTLTANLAAELAYRDYKVLMIDLDPQASLTFSFMDPNTWKKV